ncbi:DEAD/DEAH box helicase [Tunturibacter empetritectus]|uniref:ATP-dependent Lhr-like helicase n=1 Tax=Tunturiibacter empetritectus TaxID=3069691 RepID=A0A7W8IMG6_9BACT|nr:DEAD/DEAH box helicase [Edaphobacter lichenicola]MBB5319200.1 ATP-dependent Lhr-like helicase [Edaphobacter lichenicola]
MSLEVPQSLAWAHPVTAEWFLSKFGSPTEPQTYGWPGILDGNATLISAPTGSGKTLAAFLVCIDHLLRQSISGRLAPCTQVLYISPLKALSNDIQKNLDAPLAEIQQLAMQRGYLCPEIRTGVRTGDTLPKERAAMLRNPPHILVTTPESLYILLTAGKSREHLRRVQTVIVDEIHAVADDKRGAHLALSLERLDALVTGENRLSPGQFLTGLAAAPQRIGLSATQNPIELVASFLTGSHEDRKPATIVQVGQCRELDIAIEVPSDELSSVTNSGMWEEIFDKLAAHAQNHRSTLVFVNTRRLVEKIAFELATRLCPEHVAAHHGSLSRTLRLDAEQRLKHGEIKILIATASLELGIDIGDIDLVCQITTTRSVAVAMQRVGRAGHWRGATPKGRFFATTRDDLLEQAALIRKMRAGELDQLQIPPQPADVLMQQIVAACGAEPWEEDALYNILRRAYPYRNLTREAFNDLLTLLTDGIESTRGRYGAYLLRDEVQHHLHPRRGARMIAISNGGAIPDTALYSVILQPEGVQIATLDEHFAVDSSPGDVVLLGTSSWRIQRVEATGRVLVEDAHGAPPSLPFWEGEAPQRTAVLSNGVGELREQISALTPNVVPGYLSPAQPEVTAAAAWLMQQCGVCASGAQQLIAYIVAGRAALGAVPSKTTIIAERFFDDGGGMQLILHAPFGGRINKAWGLALRKRFCRGFNFELQAAATDNGINISLAEQHSFPLADVFQFLTEHTAKELLEQASIASPIFKNRWRWAAGRSLQLLRFSKGKRIAPQIQRTRSEDLMASVFPQAAACFETIVGDIQIPNHPLVNEVMQDVLQEAMDLEGLIELLRGIKEGAIRCVAVDTPTPSQFAHELLNANPYAYLDEAGLEARRARATSLGRNLPDQPGKLDQAAITAIRKEIWPDLRNEHELHDLLHSLIVLPLHAIGTAESNDWQIFYDRLARSGRVHTIDCGGNLGWVATERLSYVDALWQSASNRTNSVTKEEALQKLVQGWLQISGPITAIALGRTVTLEPAAIFPAFLAMEMQGLLMRGAFEYPAPSAAPSTGADSSHNIEWCERRILQRIHRRTVATLRKQVEPVTPAVYMRWLLNWQHLAPQTQLSGEEGVFEALRQLEGFEAPAVEWERTLLPSRVAHYDPRWLDALCLSGAVGWGRISPHSAWSAGDGASPRRVIPTNAAPVTFYIRETADWLPYALAQQCVEEDKLAAALSPAALQVRTLLQQRGACFANDIQRIANLTRQQTQQALWELATAGLAAADGFDQLRACMGPRRKSITTETSARRTARSSAGRWSLLNAELHAAPTAIEQAHRTEAALESFARQLLNRYGVLFRDLLLCESNAPRWRDLLQILRRLEARGEIRGGRFLSGFGGEQYALPEAVESLRTSRSRECSAIIAVAAADPMNLVGVVIPGDRVPAVPGRQVLYSNGRLHSETSDDRAVDLAMGVPPYVSPGQPISPLF